MVPSRTVCPRSHSPLEGNPADYDPTAEALTVDVTVAPAA